MADTVQMTRMQSGSSGRRDNVSPKWGVPFVQGLVSAGQMAESSRSGPVVMLNETSQPAGLLVISACPEWKPRLPKEESDR